MKPATWKTILLLGALTCNMGCAQLRSNRFFSGYSAGMEDYKRAKKKQYVGAWRSGYMSGVLFELSMDKMEQRIDELRRGLKP